MSSWDETSYEEAATDEAAEVVYAGFWIRVGAGLIDSVIWLPAYVVFHLAGVSSLGDPSILDLLAAVYAIVLWKTWGRTIGGRVLGLRLVRTDGEPVTWGTCVIRYIGLVISYLVLLLGVLWVIWDPKKQGWMDKMAGTYVIRAS